MINDPHLTVRGLSLGISRAHERECLVFRVAESALPPSRRKVECIIDGLLGCCPQSYLEVTRLNGDVVNYAVFPYASLTPIPP